jgi:nucleotide-binding universal stress UspA family protein
MEKDKLTESNVNFSKILVAIDDSEISMNTVDYAIQMAKKHNSQVIALHVIKIRIATSYLLAPSDTLRQINDKDKQEFKEWFEPIQTKAKENNIKIKTEIVESIMSEVGAIVTYAERENVDLIVIGSRGRTGFKKMLLGSTASGVVTYATCPVMVVK